MPPRPGRNGKALRKMPALAALLAFLLVACTTAPSPQPQGSTAAQTPGSNVTFAFGTGAKPSGLDPAVVSDTESFRITRQVLEGLVTIDAVTGKPAPSLATEWKSLKDGLDYEFTLRPNVKFHDGTSFNAAAVCANFDRWYKLPPATRGDGSNAMFGQVFRGYADNSKNSIYASCQADGELKVTLHLTMVLTGIVEALAAPAFAISSPAALKKGNADVLDQTFNDNRVSKYALAPVGTGPFKFASESANTIVLSANPSYWGTKGQISQLKFQSFTGSESRLAALLSGAIDGFDPVTPGNFDKLIKSGQQVLQRDPYSVMYVALNQQIPVLKDLKVRQAMAAAIDKQTIASNYFIAGTATTAQFIPPKLSGFNNAVTGAPFDVNKAKTLLSESSYKGEELKFYYPTNASLSYLQSPERVYAEIAKELTAVGFNIKPVPVPWNEAYQATVTSKGDHALALMGINGSYSDPDNFVGPLFGASNKLLGLEDPALVSKITRARSLPDGPERSAAYDAINKRIAESLPAIPIVFPISAIAVSGRVATYPLSPVLNEVFNQLTLTPAAK